VIIETPTIQDLAGLIVESKGMFDQMGFEKGGTRWEYDSMVKWWTDVLTTPNHDILVARSGSRIIGVSVVCYVDEFRWYKGQLQAWELAHHASPDLPVVTRCRIMIQLLKKQIENIRKRGALYFRISYDPNFPEWGNYLKKHGYIPTSHSLALKLT